MLFYGIHYLESQRNHFAFFRNIPRWLSQNNRSFSSIGSRGYCVRQFFLESIDVRNIGLVPAVVGEFYDVQIRRMSDHKIDLLSVPFAQLCCDRLGKRLSIGDIDTLDCVVDRRPFAHNAIDIIDNFLGDVESDIIFAQVFICEQGSPAACEQFQHGISGIRKRLSSWGTKLPW